MDGIIYPLITDIVKKQKEKIEEILSRHDLDIALKTAMLRLLARQIADGLARDNGYHSINEFFEEYDKGTSPIIKLEGEGVRYGKVIVLKDCPMVPVFKIFKKGTDFPEYWKRIPEEYMTKFKNEAILHPLCIIHQKFRDELASRIKKGNSVVHSVAVACRSTTSGKIVYSEFGLQMADMGKEAINLIINGRACAFVVK